MADVRINFEFSNLEDADRFLKDMLKASKELKKAMQQTGKVVQGDVEKSKRLAKAAKLVAMEKKKLSAVDREQLKIAKQLQTVNAKIAIATSKEARLLAEKQKQLRKINTQLRTGGKNTNTWAKALGSFQFKFNALGNVAANVLSRMTQQLTQFVKGSLEAYDKQIKAERSLLVAMEGRIGATDRLIRQAAQLQKTTLFGDEETIKAQALIAAFVDEEKAIKKVIPLVQDMAQAKGMDLAGAADLVSKTLGSSTNALSRYGIEVVGAVGSTERLTSLTDGMTKAFKGQAEAAAFADAQFTQFRNTLGDLQERIGGFINDAVFMARITANIWPDMSAGLDLISVAEFTANKRFNELKESITDSASAAVALENLRKESTDLNQEYKEAVDNAVNAKKKEFGAANQRVKNIREEKDVYAELIPLLEIYISGLGEVSNIDLPEISKIIDPDKLFTGDEQKMFNDIISSITLQLNGLSEAVTGFEDIELPDNFLDNLFDEGEETWIESLHRRREQYQTFLNNLGEDADDPALKKKLSLEDALNLASQATNTFTSLFESAKQKELSAAGDNAKAREEIERKYAKKQQALAISSALISTAQGVARAFKDYAFPFSAIVAGIVGGLGAAQVATIKNQKFAEGGWVDGQPHSRGGTVIEAEKGEFVVNKRSSGKYKGLIEAINQDDQVKIMDAMARDKKIQISGSGDPYNRKLYEFFVSKKDYGEDNDFYYVHKGNKTLKIHKN